MWDSCVMTWKTFLDLFKTDYELFGYKDGDWYFTNGKDIFNGPNYFFGIKINLHLFPDVIEDNRIVFFNRMQSSITIIEKEDLQWNPINKNIILY